jgi:hypothetical protein
MEEKRIFLEPDDEVTDIIDKLEQADKDIVVLIIPKSAVVFQSIVNLKLIKRKADEWNKRLAIVTDSHHGRKLADQVGIGVYRKTKVDKIVQEEGRKKVADETKERFPLALTEKKAEKGSDSGKKESSSAEKPTRGPTSTWAKRILIGAIILLILVSGVVAYLYLPKATVQIRLKGQEQEDNFDLVIKETSKLTTDQVQGEVVETTVEVSNEFDTTGHKKVGGRAKGRITIFNYWSSDPQPLVASTRFIHNSTNQLFRTTNTVTIPGTEVVEGETVPGTTTVTIQADEVGDSYNVSAGRFTIPGLPISKQSKIYGQSDNNLTGGYQKEILVVSQQDYQQAREKLNQELAEELESKFQEEIGDKTVLDKKVEQVIREEASPKVGQEAGSFTLVIQKEVSTLAYNKDEFLRTVKEKFDRRSSDDRELVLDGLDEQITIKNTELKIGEKEARLELDIKGVTIPHLDEEILRKNIVGQARTEGERYLIGYSQIEDAKIDLWPFWAKRVPTRQNRITFDISYR